MAVEPMKPVFLLSGTPGVGKTSIASALAGRLKGLHVDLTKIIVEEGLIEGYDASRGTSIADLDGLRRRVAGLMDASDGPLVIEGHFSHDVVPSGKVSRAFVLRRAPWDLKNELRSRGYPTDKVKENVDAELIGVCLSESIENMGADKVCEVDTSGRTTDDVVEELLSFINGVKPCTLGSVDWLSRDEAAELTR